MIGFYFEASSSLIRSRTRKLFGWVKLLDGDFIARRGDVDLHRGAHGRRDGCVRQ